MATTYERIRELNQSTATDPNMLRDLHDCIYQWAETIPSGGAKKDISQTLQKIYQTHSERITRKNQATQAVATAEKYQAKDREDTAETALESTSNHQQDFDNQSSFNLKDTEYDPEHILDFDSDEDEDAYYDDYH